MSALNLDPDSGPKLFLAPILWGGGGAQHACSLFKCILLEKLQLEPMIKPCSKFIFFATFSHDMFVFPKIAGFLVHN